MVEPLEKKEGKSEGGLIIPTTANANVSEGIVVSVSKEIKAAKLYAVGEKVLYYTNKGIALVDGGKSLRILDTGTGLENGDVLAVITEN